MINLLVATAPILILLVVSELLWQAKILRGESARKMLHIIIGSYVAAWAFFLSNREIELLSIALFIGVSISHRFKIFHAILDVKRKTAGDLFYAVGIGASAFLAKSPWIFAAAILHMSIGDGLAGLLGTKHGSSNRYQVWGHDKSVVGSVVFSACSVIILSVIVPSQLNINLGFLILLIPITASLVENAAVYGTDNFIIPVLITVILNSLA